MRWKDACDAVWNEAWEKGMETGVEQGRLEALRATAKRLLLEGMAVSKVAELTGLAIDVVRALGEPPH